MKRKRQIMIPTTDMILSSTEEKALKLLGAGHSPEVVAAAIGVTASRVSQLLSQEQFAIEVAKLRYESLAKHNLRDVEYDRLEDALLVKLTDLLPLMYKPMEVLRSIQVLNAAKRRGSSAPEAISQQHTTVKVVMPVNIVQRFTTNIQNQVIQAGEQTLITMQSGSLKRMLEDDNRTGEKEGTTGEVTGREETKAITSE